VNTYGAMGYDDYYFYSQDLAIGNLLQLYPTDETVPVENRISETSISLLAAGPTSSFAVVSGNQLWWWGSFAGIDEYYPVRMPGTVSAGAQILQISISYQDSGFLVDSAGGLFGFGLNSADGAHSLLCSGVPSTPFFTSLSRVPAPEKFVAISAGRSVAVATSYSATSGYSLHACGRADHSGLGSAANVSNNGFISSFTMVKTNMTSVSVAVGDGHVLLLEQNSRVSWYAYRLSPPSYYFLIVVCTH
jgi:hypothetical protein